MKRQLVAISILLTTLTALGCTTMRPWSPSSRDSDWLAELDARTTDHTDKKSIVILLIGDSGKLRGLQKIVPWIQQSCEATCDLALMLGDNFYTFGPRSAKDRRFKTRFSEPLRGLGDGFDVWAVLGNHGYLGLANPEAQVEYTFQQQPQGGPDWLMPARYYQIPKLPSWLNVVAFDTEFVVDHRHFQGSREEYGEARDKYLTEVVAALDAKEGWRILLGHHPLLTTGDHWPDSDLKELRDRFKNSRPFDLYIAGHDHDQQVIDGSDFVQIVQGAASKTRLKWTDADRRAALASQVQALPSWFKDPARADYCALLGFGVLKLTRLSAHLVAFTEEGLMRRTWTWLRDENGRVSREHHSQDPPGNFCPMESQ